jgi:hypothetical protein
VTAAGQPAVTSPADLSGHVTCALQQRLPDLTALNETLKAAGKPR